MNESGGICIYQSCHLCNLPTILNLIHARFDIIQSILTHFFIIIIRVSRSFPCIPKYVFTQGFHISILKRQPNARALEQPFNPHQKVRLYDE
ncbi:hypothetical protein DID88_007345 [Monilinia fructigena]|uniref:Uncharacterized protein n=1 Tax=Monilinia fructigena TaxID=38457 RepID=A0A395J818_9HELO|nr:hypothetical protein DID88_007345 [Monilinia fructigena]